MIIQLKKGKEGSVFAKNLWIHDHQIEAVSNGEKNKVATVTSYDGVFLAKGLYLKGGRIALRILSFLDEEIDGKWLANKIEEARIRKERLGFSKNFRLIHSEGDMLSGLVIDVFEDVLSIQAAHPFYVDSLKTLFSDRQYVLFRTDLSVKEPPLISPLMKKRKEGVFLKEGGATLVVDPAAGQKTGFYYDQRENRRKILPYVKNKNVLDLCCYSGSFSLFALEAGAKSATLVDSSSFAIEQAKKNVRVNGFEERATFYKEDVDQFLEKEEKLFDVVILDPPKFAKSFREKEAALRKYFALIRKAMRRVVDGGHFFCFSCSYHVTIHDFFELVRKAAIKEKKWVKVLDVLTQDNDHTILATMPESFYLKGLHLEVCAFSAVSSFEGKISS